MPMFFDQAVCHNDRIKFEAISVFDVSVAEFLLTPLEMCSNNRSLKFAIVNMIERNDIVSNTSQQFRA